MTDRSILPEALVMVLEESISVTAPIDITKQFDIPFGMTSDFYFRLALIMFDELLHGSGDAIKAAERGGRWWNALARLGLRTPSLIETRFHHLSFEHCLALSKEWAREAPGLHDEANESIAPLQFPASSKFPDVTRYQRCLEAAWITGHIVNGIRVGFERGEPISFNSAMNIVTKKFRTRTNSRAVLSVGLSKNTINEVWKQLEPVLPLAEGFAQVLDRIDQGEPKEYVEVFAFAEATFDSLARVRIPKAPEGSHFDKARALRVRLVDPAERADAALARIGNG